MLGFAGSPQRDAVLAQSTNSTDDGLFTVFTTIDYDSNNVVSAYASDPDEDPEDYDDFEYWYLDAPPVWQLTGNGYSNSGEGESFSSGGPVPGGSTYTASFYFSITFFYASSGDDGDCEFGALEDGDCEGWDYPAGYASIDVPYPPPQITGLSTYSAYQGDQATLTITGTNLVETSGDQLFLNFSGSSNPFTLVNAPATCTSTCTATFAYDFSGYPIGSFLLSLTNNEGTSNNEPFTVSAPPPPPDPCAVTSNPQAGYSSIVSTGTAASSGTMSVSFSGAAYAAISQNVTYGPYSTPSSIAANIASLITYNYFQHGLSAKAFGPNIVYSGITPLGTVTVSDLATGPSFTTTASPAAAAETESSCDEAPPQLPSAIISMHFIGSKNPLDRLQNLLAPYECSENLGPVNCPNDWLWNLEGTVIVTDDVTKWTVQQKIVSGTTTYMFRDSAGALQQATFTDTPGPDGPNPGFLQQNSGLPIIFWIDGPGFSKETVSNHTVDSGISTSVYSVSVCSKIYTSICATKSWTVKLVIDPGQVLDDTFSNASVK
jgi:hypothetical protein